MFQLSLFYQKKNFQILNNNDMPVSKADKAIYRIYDTKKEEYYSTGKKSTWSTKGGAYSAAANAYKPVKKRMSYEIEIPVGYLEDNIEIHIYPLDSATKIKFVEMRDEVQSELADIKRKALEKQISDAKAHLLRLEEHLNKNK